MIEYKVDLDMTPGRAPTEVQVKQYDTDFSIAFSLIGWRGDLTVENGTTARIRGTKPDGYGYSVPAALDIEKKVVTVQGDEQMTAASGRAKFELALLKGTEVLTSATFYMQVYPAALDDGTVISESDITEFRQAIDAAAQAAASANTAATQAAAATASKTAAAASATAAAQAAEDAAAVFALAGNVSFVVLDTGKVRMYFAD